VITIDRYWDLCWTRRTEYTPHLITIPCWNYPPNKTSQEATSGHGFRLNFCTQISLRPSASEVPQVLTLFSNYRSLISLNDVATENKPQVNKLNDYWYKQLEFRYCLAFKMFNCKSIPRDHQYFNKYANLIANRTDWIGRLVKQNVAPTPTLPVRHNAEWELNVFQIFSFRNCNYKQQNEGLYANVISTIFSDIYGLCIS
jgi:hypothetical protein